MIRIRLALALFLLITLASPNSRLFFEDIVTYGGSYVYAQTPKFPYKNYGDRKEGIVPSLQLVAGEKLKLVSVAIENGELPPQPKPTTYNLGFYLEKLTRLEIVVGEFDKRYKMEPLRKEYPAGINTFSWPSNIPLFYKIEIPHLFPLAIVSGTGDEKIVPIVLFYGKPKNTDIVYRFCFVPQQTIAVLQYKIYSPRSLEPVYSDTLRNLIAEEAACLRWNGKAQNNKAVNDGLYNLFIDATFKPLPGERAREVSFKYQFYHYAKILKSDWVSSK